MDTLLYDLLGTLARALASQVCDAILRNNDLHRVLTVIEVGDHRDKGRDLTVLRRGGSSEDGEVAITGEVSRAPYPVHHTGTVDVGGVDVAEDVRF